MDASHSCIANDRHSFLTILKCWVWGKEVWHAFFPLMYCTCNNILEIGKIKEFQHFHLGLKKWKVLWPNLLLFSTYLLGSRELMKQHKLEKKPHKTKMVYNHRYSAKGLRVFKRKNNPHHKTVPAAELFIWCQCDRILKREKKNTVKKVFEEKVLCVLMLTACNSARCDFSN